MSEYLIKEEFSNVRSSGVGGSGFKVDSLAEAVNHDKDGVMFLLGDRELGDEVHADLLPSFLGDGEWLQESRRFPVGSFVSLAGIAGGDIGLDLFGHLGPKEVVSDVGNGFVNAKVSCNGSIVVVVKDLESQGGFVGDAQTG